MLELLDILVVGFSICIIIVTKLLDRHPAPILGIYQRPNGLYWVKAWFMYTVLSLRKLLKKEETDFTHLEKPQKLSHHEKAIDAVYLNGANHLGDHLVVGTARRKHLLVDGFLYLKICSSGLGVLETPKLPGTALYKTEESNEYDAEGVKITPLEPMRKWRLTYRGKMKENRDRSKIHDVAIDAVWTSDLPWFDYDTDMDPLCMAKSMAYEKWNRTYFDVLKANHQSHYEQFGVLKASVVIDGVNFDTLLDTVRDHSFSVHREWRQFKRYGLHFFSAENGDRFSLGKVCLPVTFSRLTIGYVYSAEDDKIHAVQDCDLELFQHGELGTPPKDYAFSFTAGGKTYTVKVNVVDSPHFYISKDWEAKVFERLCRFEVNGVQGWGAAEWQYRNIQGKNVSDYSNLEME
ncbi:hypothetical protein NQ315_011704 [Exocentrus adspersus]|uniref:DUF7064 domain-containing protein n=1 Tax=Exocentrus adspersus TaxID=1586481 RepID=A0AAV8W290_9CUCU|nr:hypothetical protein NQ315_011704 [Exocentrus adspersus]